MPIQSAGADAASLYDVLGVRPDADAREIRSRYLDLAKLHHPDKLGSNGSGRILALNEAYEVLGDPARRSAYDAWLASLRNGTRDSVDSALRTAQGASFGASASQAGQRQARIAAEVSIETFEAVEAHSAAADNDTGPDMQAALHFRYPCRCGNHYIISADQLADGVQIIQCSGCSEVIRVVME